MKLIYISGKYSDINFWKVDFNIRKAKNEAIALIREVGRHGYFPITPHLNTGHFEEREEMFEGVNFEYWLNGTIELLKRCDAMLLLDNWEDSNGAKKEIEIAVANGMPVYYSIEELKKACKKEKNK